MKSFVATVLACLILGGSLLPGFSIDQSARWGKLVQHYRQHQLDGLSQNDFRCQWHGGLFTIDGSVKGPPPTRPQQLLSSTLSADKNSLHVTE